MNRVYSIAFLLILVVAPMFPLLMVQPSNANPSTSFNDTSEEIVDIGTPDALLEGDVELNMMFFTETPSTEDGLYYVCRSGTDSIAYFGASMVQYISGGIAFTLEFPGSNEVIPQGENPTGSVTNYLLGNDPSKWNTDIADCAVLRYSEIYPGIDLVYKFHDGALKYEFVVAPNANPDLIQMRYPDASMLDVHDDHITVSKSEFAFSDTGLWAFQGSEEIEDVSCAFQSQDMNTIGFDVGYYEKSKELVIDPILVYSTFLGGSGADYGYSIAVDDGYVYVTGNTGSANFPTVNGYNSTYSGGTYDVFVTKLAADGKSLIYSTFLGGAGEDNGRCIAVEGGYAYITGYTESTDFPTTPNAFNETYNGGLWDCFVTKLAINGSALNYSTYLGGTSHEFGHGIDVEDGFAYIAGYTLSTNFITVNALYPSDPHSNYDVFVTKFAVDGQSLVYSTYFGASHGYDIAVESGFVYITGDTWFSDTPTTTNAYDESHNGGTYDCFVTKFAVDGQYLVYSTYIGGSGDYDYAYAIDVENGFAYITGETDSTDFPTTPGAYDSSYDAVADCFVTKLAADGESLIYSTFLNGKYSDIGYGIAVEGGSAYITGNTFSTDFHTYNAFDSTHNGNYDVFMTKFSADGESLLYSTYLGGTDYDYGRGIAVVNDTIYITGYTGSSEFPTTVDAYNSTRSGGNDCFISIFSQDSDSDGLSDWQESYLGTDRLCIDTDNDNFLDGYEDAYGSDPLDPMDYPAMPQAWYDEIYEDLNGNEAQILVLTALISGNTDFLNSLNASHYFLNGTYMDDYDGVEDALDEIRDVLDELGISVGDSDYDGLDDLDEISYGTDLLCIDTDVDNLNDAFEVKLGTDPLNDDSDGDTYLDGLEYIAGSDPLDPLSYPGAPQDFDPMIIAIALGGIGLVIIVVVIAFNKMRSKN